MIPRTRPPVPEGTDPLMTALPTAPLLVELLTEELPPKALARLADAFADGLRERLAAAGLIGEHAQVAPFA
ncbi:MAG: hypothetical protein ACHP7E_11020, partial [Burkholderiales bacterium]